MQFVLLLMFCWAAHGQLQDAQNGGAADMLAPTFYGVLNMDAPRQSVASDGRSLLQVNLPGIIDELVGSTPPSPAPIPVTPTTPADTPPPEASPEVVASPDIPAPDSPIIESPPVVSSPPVVLPPVPEPSPEAPPEVVPPVSSPAVPVPPPETPPPVPVPEPSPEPVAPSPEVPSPSPAPVASPPVPEPSTAPPVVPSPIPVPVPSPNDDDVPVEPSPAPINPLPSPRSSPAVPVASPDPVAPDSPPVLPSPVPSPVVPSPEESPPIPVVVEPPTPVTPNITSPPPAISPPPVKPGRSPVLPSPPSPAKGRSPPPVSAVSPPPPSPSPPPGSEDGGTSGRLRPPSPPPSPAESGGSDGSTGVIAIAAGVGGGVALILVIVTIIFCSRRKKPQPPSTPATSAGQLHLTKPDGKSIFDTTTGYPMAPPAHAKARASNNGFAQNGQQLATDVTQEYQSSNNNMWPSPATPARSSSSSQMNYQQQGVHKVPAIPGLLPADPFIRNTAPIYRWTDYLHNDASVCIEAGINDWKLDALLPETRNAYNNQNHYGSQPWGSSGNSFTSVSGANMGDNCPVVQLTSAQIMEEIELLPSGLLGKGATAMVFKGRWPRRFGEHGLVAVKVLKDAFEAENSAMLESFIYEAGVLASVNHPNIVRLYGFCVEAPTVCLILELLPFTLKERLYPHLAQRQSVPRPGNSGHSSREQQPFVLQGSNSVALDVRPAGHGHKRTGSSESLQNAMRAYGNGYDDYNSAGHSNAQGYDGNGIGRAGLPPLAPSVSTSGGGFRPRNIRSAPGNHQSLLTMLEVLQYSTDIASGLAYLHEKPITPGQGPADWTSTLTHLLQNETIDEAFGSAVIEGKARIVHRDLKPANILISSQGRAKISDFGLARKHQSTTVQTVHLGAGTLPYMAPELLIGRHAGPYAQAATNRVDIYSMAMIMWEMISGSMPWSGMSEMEILAAVTAGQRPSLPTGQGGLDGEYGNALYSQSSRGSGGMGSAGPSENMDLQSLAITPATVHALPPFNQIITSAWTQRELRRPTAEKVLAMLQSLLQKASRNY